MSGPDDSSSVQAVLARLLTEPELLAALERRDLAELRRQLDARPPVLEAIASIDIAAFKFYRRRLQRKRLETMENIFVASLPAARNAYGPDAVAADFWHWYQPPAAVPVHEVLAMIAQAWTRFAAELAGRGQLAWLGDLSRYELMRWRAKLAEAPSSASSARRPRGRDEIGNVALAPGTGVDSFVVDVPLLLRTALEGSPVVSRRMMRLITWSVPAGGIRTAEIGAAIHQAILSCDGSRTVEQVAAVAGGHKEGAGPRIAATLRDLVAAGALLSSAVPEVTAEHEHSAGVQFADGS